ncbi:flagellin N-terminal helical domain-containing protein [Devosia beringensis]|uniref:flagellin N-terminal helical domain-containing protein n=1 Tax=Devosia beringensis TaxID=2657486 RepID=UPI00186B8933|nr:flagellin [Devosia beringensis]
MSDISLSKAVRSNLLALQGTADMMATAQNRLSTGNKVNSALDNPSNWFTAKGLTNRSSDLNALMDSMANGIQTLKAADNGLSAMTKTLESMQSTLRQARQDKSFQTTSLGIDAAATGNLTIAGGSVGSTAISTNVQKAVVTGNGGFAAAGGRTQAAGAFSFTQVGVNNGNANTVNFAKGDTAADVAKKINEKMALTLGGSVVKAEVENGQLKLTNSSNTTFGVFTGGELVGLSAQTAATATAETRVGTATVGSGITFTGGDIVIGGKTVTLTAGSAADTATTNSTRAAQEINDGLQSQGETGFYASVAGNTVTITRADGEAFTVSGAGAATTSGLSIPTAATQAGVAPKALVAAPPTKNMSKTADELVESINANTALVGRVRASNDNGKLRLENQSTQKLDIIGASAGNINGSTVARTEVAGNSVRAGLASQFNELRDQLDKLADDASFNGINLMRGDNLTITFNETGTSSIDIRTKNGQTINASNLGVPTQLEEKQLDSDANIDSLLMDMKSALDDVRSQASTFGSNLSIVQNRQDFTKAMISTLETGAGNLTLADMNEEAANLLALQTRQQLSSNSLSLASQADQSILQLLR